MEQNEIPLSEKGMLLKDDEQQLAFSFTPIASMLSVGYKNYNTFYDSVLSYLYPLKEYVFKVLGRRDVDAYLRKVNVFSFENQPDLAPEKQERLFLQNVFSSAFLNAEEAKSRATIDGEDTEMIVRNFVIDDFAMEIRTYFLHRDNGLTSLFLDSIVNFDADSSNFEDLLQTANSLLYDSYHWTVSEGIIDIMSVSDLNVHIITSGITDTLNFINQGLDFPTLLPGQEKQLDFSLDKHGDEFKLCEPELIRNLKCKLHFNETFVIELGYKDASTVYKETVKLLYLLDLTSLSISFIEQILDELHFNSKPSSLCTVNPEVSITLVIPESFTAT